MSKKKASIEKRPSVKMQIGTFDDEVSMTFSEPISANYFTPSEALSIARTLISAAQIILDKKKP